MIDHVAIIGAGFSGTLLAVNLLRHAGPRATLIERAAVPGEGLAYGAAHPDHLLNVRAASMSAFPDDPGHFARWLEARGHVDAAAAFVPRLTYGDYLRELLDAAVARSAGRLSVLRGDVCDVARSADGVRLAFADGRSLAADAAVLAVGNLPPHAPPGIDPDLLSPERYRGDPWAPGLAEGLGAADRVLIIGSGLTMVDVVLTLEAQGFAGDIVALSRRGLLPHRHVPAGGDWQAIDERPAAAASALVASVRGRAAAIGWRPAVDELRPFTQSMWRNASDEQRRRFIRHLRPWWDVHRHRLAPPVAARLDRLRASGRLVVRAGKTIAAEERTGDVAVTWRPRGEAASRCLAVKRIVNCTGPQGDLKRTTEPLLMRLTERGAIRPDSARLGIDVDSEARTVAADGGGNDDLYALGPMTRGAFWEIVAVPDIRAQSWTLARRLSNAHWVGGEGL